jgi:hypothetical protein
MWSLLDSDQPQPWPDQPLVYYQKYRFYYQEYTEGFHVVSVPRQGWGIAAAGGNAEYVAFNSCYYFCAHFSLYFYSQICVGSPYSHRIVVSCVAHCHKFVDENTNLSYLVNL